MSNYYETKVFDYSQLTTSDLLSLPCAYMRHACMRACLHESPRAQRPYQCDLTSAPAEVNESGRVVRRRAIAVLPR